MTRGKDYSMQIFIVCLILWIPSMIFVVWIGAPWLVLPIVLAPIIAMIWESMLP